MASNPEFLREGTAVRDFLHPDRIVVGIDDPEAEKQLREIYQPILDGSVSVPGASAGCPRAAGAVSSGDHDCQRGADQACLNSFLGLKISYANLIADLCEKLGADVEEVTRAMGLDPRIGPQFLNAGLGFGGFCLPKDIQAFVRLAERHGVEFSLLKEVEQINKRRVDQFLEKTRHALWVVKDKKVGVLGLAFKPIPTTFGLRRRWS